MSLEPVAPGSSVRLTDAGAGPPNGAPSKEEALARLEPLARRMDARQVALYAEGKRALLVVLQGRDTSGKDGTIRKVFGPLDPQGLWVTGFKAPTPVELAHDYLWRVHQAVPPKGTVGVFNRSHYEDVLVVRVHDLVPPEVWGRRYGHIADFERLLTDEGTTIRKFFLHISKEEQAARLQARIEDPTKRWKFRLADLDERKLWDDYQQAYEDAIRQTATPAAPWTVVPADRKWHRDLVISRTIVETLERLDLRYPELEEDLSGIVVE
jgi:PPK2 family polyphosphate:nucleotide phosphotransferase